MQHHDSVVALRSSVCISLAAIAAALLVSAPGPTHACSVRGPGIFGRTVWPAPGANPPINARFYVSYLLGGNSGGSAIPPIGPDVALLDDDGTPVATSTEVVGSHVIIRPTAALLPNRPYKVTDHRLIPCEPTQGECPLTAAPQVIATFTTGAAADTEAPNFTGLTGATFLERTTCDSSACCGPYDLYSVEFSWSSGKDNTAGGDLRYNVYRREGGALVVGLVEGLTAVGVQTCSGGFPSPGRLELPPGTYVVRAVDWAGNEDSNDVAKRIGAACSDHDVHACAVSGTQADDTRGLWLVLVVGTSVAGLTSGRRWRASVRSRQMSDPYDGKTTQRPRGWWHAQRGTALRRRGRWPRPMPL